MCHCITSPCIVTYCADAVSSCYLSIYLVIHVFYCASRITLGKGIHGLYGDAHICEAEECNGTGCEISAVCSSVNHDYVIRPHGYYQLDPAVHSFQLEELKELPWTRQTAALYSFHNKNFQTICFWIKCAADAFIGSILYLANNHNQPVIALGGGSVKDSGVVIMPNGEELYFNINLLRDSLWHHVCLRFRGSASPEFRCKLYIDGSVAAKTSTLCYSGLLPKSGQMFIGRGADAITPLQFDENESVWAQNLSMLSNSDTKLIFSTPYAGQIGNFSFYEEAISQSTIRNIVVSCLDRERMSPMILSSLQEIPQTVGITMQITSGIYTDYNSKPCTTVSTLPCFVFQLVIMQKFLFSGGFTNPDQCHKSAV